MMAISSKPKRSFHLRARYSKLWAFGRKVCWHHLAFWELNLGANADRRSLWYSVCFDSIHTKTIRPSPQCPHLKLRARVGEAVLVTEVAEYMVDPDKAPWLQGKDGLPLNPEGLLMGLIRFYEVATALILMLRR